MKQAHLTFVRRVSTSGNTQLLAKGFAFLQKVLLETSNVAEQKEFIIPIKSGWPSDWERYTQAFGHNGHTVTRLPVFWQELPHEMGAKDYVTPHNSPTSSTAFFCLQTGTLSQLDEVPLASEELTFD